jgi:8-oxo-dGTP pyrophosphatase MutT (NUDIX family)
MRNNQSYHDLINNESQLYQSIHFKLMRHKKRVFSYSDVSFPKRTPAVKEAAVLIPLFFKFNEAYLLFTKRTDLVAHHKGQISFPGGIYENGDINLEKTALRETEEEMGIKHKDVTILGQTDQYVTNTNFLVTPFVGHFTSPYKYRINKAEITEVIEVPLKVIMDPRNFEIRKMKGANRNLHYYYYIDNIIWGVTGFILSNFLTIVFDLQDRHGINKK